MGSLRTIPADLDLVHETTDADTFASWEADLLKCDSRQPRSWAFLIFPDDNCYSDAAAGYPDADYTPDVSPDSRYADMSDAILATGRPILFQICDWGVDFPSAWAPALGNTWRITNDIIPAYRTISRILNQAVPQTTFAGPGQWLDLDMLEVGNQIFTTAEEQTHFSLWSIIKSPLVIGAALKDTYTSISASSLAILNNIDVISYNQDSLGVAASFRRRWTAEGYEVWAGPLSGGRTIVAVINLSDASKYLALDFPDVGLQTAATVKDIWNGVTSKNVLTSYVGEVQAHGVLLLELRDTTPAGQYSLADAKVSGYVYACRLLSFAYSLRNTASFSKVYGATTSSNFTLLATFAQATSLAITIMINDTPHTIAAGALSFTASLSLLATNDNALTITSHPLPTSITITNPPAAFYPSTSFTLSGSSTRTTCSSGLCTPVGSKIGYLSPSGSASLSLTSPASSLPGSKLLEVYFCNNDIAFSTSWTTGTNTRNMTISVNGEVTRIEVPLSGRSSELFSPGLGWEDTGKFVVLAEGWVNGVNEVVVGNEDGAAGLVSDGADFVGLAVYW